jgi:hypothetical protein
MSAVPQHMQALEQAQHTRRVIQQFRREVMNATGANGALKVADLIDTGHEDPLLGAARVGWLLSAIRGLGPQKARKCLTAARVISSETAIRDLDGTQRIAIVFQLEHWAESRR